MTIEERREMVNRHLQTAVRTGAVVEAQGDTYAVLVWGRPINHVLHLLLTIVTGGLWVVGWLALAIFGGERRHIHRR